DQLPLRGQPGGRRVQPAARHRVAGRDDRPTAEPPGRAPLAYLAPGRQSAAAGTADHAGAVRAVSATRPAVVASATEGAGRIGSGRQHGAGRYRRVEPIGRAGLSGQLRGTDSGARSPVLARGHLRAFRRQALVPVLRFATAATTAVATPGRFAELQ